MSHLPGAQPRIADPAGDQRQQGHHHRQPQAGGHGRPAVLRVDQRVDEAHGHHHQQHDQIGEVFTGALSPANDALNQRPQRHQGARQHGAGDQPGGEVGPLHFIGGRIGQVTEQRAQEQRQWKGKQDGVQRMQRTRVIRYVVVSHDRSLAF